MVMSFYMSFYVLFSGVQVMGSRQSRSTNTFKKKYVDSACQYEVEDTEDYISPQDRDITYEPPR